MAIHESECVALKRRGSTHVTKLLSGKSQQEQLDFWHERTQRLMSHNKSFQPTPTASASGEFWC